MQRDAFAMSPSDHTTDMAGASSSYDPAKWLGVLSAVLPGDFGLLGAGATWAVSPGKDGTSPISKGYGAIGDAITPGWFKAFLAWFDGLRLITVLLGVMILGAGLFALVAGQGGDTTVNLAAAGK